MCFLKVSHEEVQMNSAFQPPVKSHEIEQESQSTIQQSNLDLSQYYQYLQMVTSINMGLISSINTNLDSNMQKMKEMEDIVDDLLTIPNNKQVQQEPLVTSLDPLLKQTFGQKAYKFKLGLIGKPPKTLYKQRNFDLKIVLKNEKGEIVKNANPISLYFGVMTKQGEWIDKNKQGQDMVKGLSQVDLIHGKASFSKIYLREISSYYPKKKLNFVVYPKQSLLKFSNCTNLEERISQNDIRPLLIKDITVLSKKK